MFLAALTVRTVALDRIPPGLWFDEALYCLSGHEALLAVRGGWPLPIFFMTEDRPHEPLYPYLLAAMMSLAGPNTEAMRLVSALIGAATVVALWLALRRLRGEPVATIAAAGLVFFRWHLHFSRTIFRATLAPLWICLVVWAVARAFQRRRRLDWILAGFLLGSGFYTYLSFRLIPALLALWAAAEIYRVWREERAKAAAERGTWRRIKAPLPGVALALFTACLVLLPLGSDYLKHPDHFWGRSDEVKLFGHPAPSANATALSGVAATPALPPFYGKPGHHTGWKGVAENALLNVAQFLLPGWGDRVAKHNIPYQPIFDPLSALFFLIGLGTCAWRLLVPSSEFRVPSSELGTRNSELGTRNCPPAGGLALFWLGVMLLNSVFSYGAPNILRSMAGAPAAIWIWAEGLWAAAGWLKDLAAQRRGRPSRALTNGALRGSIVVAVMTYFAALQVYDYFWVFPRSEQVWHEFNTGIYDVGRALKRLDPARETAWIGEDILNHPTVKFELLGTSVTRPLDLPAAWMRSPASPARPAQDHLILATTANNLIDLLMREFPQGRIEQRFRTPRGMTWAWFYRIPAGRLLDPAAPRSAVESRRVPN